MSGELDGLVRLTLFLYAYWLLHHCLVEDVCDPPCWTENAWGAALSARTEMMASATSARPTLLVVRDFIGLGQLALPK